MLKRKVSKDNYSVLTRYISLGKKVTAITKERKEILKALFPGDKLTEETISCTVPGLSGVVFAVVRTVFDKTDYKAIVVRDYTDEKELEAVKAEYSKPVGTVKVKM